MQGFEIRSLTEVIRQMSNYDVSLFPYLNAYVTTQSSETLWYGKGERLASFENKIITLRIVKSSILWHPRSFQYVGNSLQLQGTGKKALRRKYERFIYCPSMGWEER